MLSPPPLTFRQFEKPPESSHHVATPKLVTHNEKIGSKTMTFTEKVGTRSNGQGDKDEMQRRRSWKLASKPSLRRKKVGESGSDSEAVPLNNGRDHSQCNGGGVSRQVIYTIR